MESDRDGFTELLRGDITSGVWGCLRYTTVNDNADPRALNSAGFQFTELDSTMVRVVLPFRQRLQARGETLGLTLTWS
jgi:hypothetical protein